MTTQEVDAQRLAKPPNNSLETSESSQSTGLGVSDYKNRKYNQRVTEPRSFEISLEETLDYIRKNPKEEIQINYSAARAGPEIMDYVKSLGEYNRVTLIPETNLSLEIYSGGEWVGYLDNDYTKTAISSLYNEIASTNNLSKLFGE